MQESRHTVRVLLTANLAGVHVLRGKKVESNGKCRVN